MKTSHRLIIAAIAVIGLGYILSTQFSHAPYEATVPTPTPPVIIPILMETIESNISFAEERTRIPAQLYQAARFHGLTEIYTSHDEHWGNWLLVLSAPVSEDPDAIRPKITIQYQEEDGEHTRQFGPQAESGAITLSESSESFVYSDGKHDTYSCGTWDISDAHMSELTAMMGDILKLGAGPEGDKIVFKDGFFDSLVGRNDAIIIR